MGNGEDFFGMAATFSLPIRTHNKLELSHSELPY